jgi:tRNA threonylcarbamoyl adenosine modification protein YeaZ
MMGLGQGPELFAKRCIECDSHRYHSALIVPAIQDLLRETGLSIRELGALGVNHGPGSFTGIRTGIITIRTMAQFLNLPVQVFNQFELLAFEHQEPISIYLDALRGRAYHAALYFNSSGPVYEQSPVLRHIEASVETGENLLVSTTLASLFPAEATRFISEELFTPTRMASLGATHTEIFTQPWQRVKPLYLQEPSITLKKQILPHQA